MLEARQGSVTSCNPSDVIHNVKPIAIIKPYICTNQATYPSFWPVSKILLVSIHQYIPLPIYFNKRILKLFANEIMKISICILRMFRSLKKSNWFGCIHYTTLSTVTCFHTMWGWITQSTQWKPFSIREI